MNPSTALATISLILTAVLMEETIIQNVAFKYEANREQLADNQYTLNNNNLKQEDALNWDQHQIVKYFQGDKYQSYRTINIFGDNYQESTSANVPNLVPIIQDGNFLNEQIDTGQPHDVWINFLNGSSAIGVKDMQFVMNVNDYGVPFSTARRLLGDCHVIVEILDVDQAECQNIFKGVQKQVEDYILQYQDQGWAGRIALETQLILTGSIDVINSRPEEIFYDTLPSQLALSIKQAIDKLLQAGAQDIKVANLPPLYMTPYALSRFNDGKEKVKELVFRVNHAIQEMIQKNYQGLQRGVKLIDFHGVVVGAIWEAESRGYDVNIIMQYNSKEPKPDRQKLTFWLDAIHPVALGHELIARNIARHLLT